MSQVALTLFFWFILASLYIKKTENLMFQVQWPLLATATVGFVFFYLFRTFFVTPKDRAETYATVWIKSASYSVFCWILVFSATPQILSSFHFFHWFFFLSLLPALHLVLLVRRKVESSVGIVDHLLSFFSLVTPALILHLSIRVTSQNPFFRISLQSSQILASLVFIYAMGVMFLLNSKTKIKILDLKNWVPGFVYSYFGLLTYLILLRS